jgi:DNA-binding MarR family transcriptional regulator/N-acetylglutamate synthase-like GNAT family acetyltransferase
MMSESLEAQVAAVREFNRFYTRRIGVLDEGYLASPYSLTESRVLYELARRGSATASELCRDLGLDQGYLSRILARFGRAGLIVRTQSKKDARQSHVALTVEGRMAFAPLDGASHEAAAALLKSLAPAERDGLVRAMTEIETLLGASRAAAPWLIRAPRPGDMGWIVHRQAVLYAEEYGWNDEFETLCAEIVAAFVKNFVAERERCWIAEREGSVVGSIFLVRDTDEAAKLRLLYVEASARGLGIGARLVEACVAQARDFGYRKLVLWTNDVLTSARRLYEAAGFRLVNEERHQSFGKDLVGQTWELEL